MSQQNFQQGSYGQGQQVPYGQQQAAYGAAGNSQQNYKPQQAPYGQQGAGYNTQQAPYGQQGGYGNYAQQPQQPYGVRPAAPGAQARNKTRKLRTDRSLESYIPLQFFSLGVYSFIHTYFVAQDINKTAGSHDHRKTMNAMLALVCSIGIGLVFTILVGIIMGASMRRSYYGGVNPGMILLGILVLPAYKAFWWYWMHMLTKRIGDEARRRGVGDDFGPKTFWLWGVLGSLIIVGKYIFLYRLCENMNAINDDYNQNGR